MNIHYDLDARHSSGTDSASLWRAGNTVSCTIITLVPRLTHFNIALSFDFFATDLPRGSPTIRYIGREALSSEELETATRLEGTTLEVVV